MFYRWCVLWICDPTSPGHSSVCLLSCADNLIAVDQLLIEMQMSTIYHMVKSSVVYLYLYKSISTLDSVISSND